MSAFLHTLIQDIHNGEILALVDELEHACPVAVRGYLRAPLVGFFMQCVYPSGDGKRVPITTALALETPLLDSKVGKIDDGDLRDLCAELAKLTNKALEFYQGHKVLGLLNRSIPKQPAPVRSTPTQKRWDAVVRQRRANW